VTQPTTTPPRVLIGEDESLIRLDVRRLLEAAGCSVCAEARNGLEAVALSAEQQPDVIVLDMKMPRLDGVEAARRILQLRPVPIIMLTAYGYGDLISRALDVGVWGYIVKPFREQDLVEAVLTAAARFGHERKHEALAYLRSDRHFRN
jgi:AmiR/NasT family two-component response regulator